MTEYVATRWYRAPEIMLSFANYVSTWALFRMIMLLIFTGKIDHRHRRLVGRVYFGRIAWRETNLQGERVRHI